MPDSLTTKPAATTEKNGASSGPQVNVFAVHGVEPEVQAYAMAKYSRSALSMKESLKEISEQKAEQFLKRFISSTATARSPIWRTWPLP